MNLLPTDAPPKVGPEGYRKLHPASSLGRGCSRDLRPQGPALVGGGAPAPSLGSRHLPAVSDGDGLSQPPRLAQCVPADGEEVTVQLVATTKPPPIIPRPCQKSR